MIRTITFSALLFLAPVAVAAQASKPAPALHLKIIDGRDFHLADYKGKVVLLNFWATWCPPCRQEIPELIKLQREYRSQGLQIVGVTYPPQNVSQVRQFARRVKINYPVVVGTKQTKLLFASTETLPITAIIDTEGNLRDVIEGIMYRDEFDEKVKPMLLPEVITQRRVQRTRQPRLTKLQTRTIIVNAESYQPAVIKLSRGVPARLTFIRKTAEGCGTEVVIPAYKINRPLPLNQLVIVKITPTRAGRFKMTCGMEMFRGAIIVR
jgi:thiol-disulfide isomerase/thioredoxin